MTDALEDFKDQLANGDEEGIYAAACDCAWAGVEVVTLGRLVRQAGYKPPVALAVFNIYKEVRGAR